MTVVITAESEPTFICSRKAMATCCALSSSLRRSQADPWATVAKKSLKLSHVVELPLAEHTMYNCRRARAWGGRSPKVASTSGPLPYLAQSYLQARHL